MCQQTDMGLQIEQLYLQGMPRKIGRTVEYVLLKKQNCIICKRESDKSDNNNNNDNDKLVKCTCATNDSVNEKKITFKNNTMEVNHKKNTINKKINSETTIKEDILAVGTRWTRIFLGFIGSFGSRMQRTNFYKVLCHTTQPAHVIALGILSFVLLAIWPNLIEGNIQEESSSINRSTAEESQKLIKNSKNILTLLTYLGAFATHFGSQIWMTFVSGLSLYFALPRHTFGLCQQILFPKYFALNSILSILTLITYVKMIDGRWEFSSFVQVTALAICAIIEVAVRLYLAPPLLKLMREKHKFEISIGSGMEIGHLDARDLIKCPHYQRIQKAFRRTHMIVAMGNLTSLGCTFLHLHYLASKITVI